MKNFNNYMEQGFTLIELMISITLGLLVIAIASQIYLTSYSTNVVQKSSGELAEGSIFGIQQLESHIRLANLGNQLTSIDDTTLDGGIILSQNNAPKIDKSFLTSGGGFTDRLTIQFKNATTSDIYNCEGVAVKSGYRVIESYFLEDGDLKCDASRTTPKNPNILKDLGSNAQTVIKDVDTFGIRLGVQNATGTAYMTTADYLAFKGKKPVITSIKMGLLLRGSKPITGTIRKNFQVLGQNVVVDGTPNVSGNYVRGVYESNTYLRNARFVE